MQLVDNPYWAAVQDFVVDVPYPFATCRAVCDQFIHRDAQASHAETHHPSRFEYVRRYGLLIPDPDTVMFLLQHAGPRILDPIAGCGYLAWILEQSGVDVLAFDRKPWDQTYGTVQVGHAPDTVARYGHDRTLILSWPDYDDPTIEAVLTAYRGDRVIVIAEESSCGTPRFWSTLRRRWRQVAQHTPVGWLHFRDDIWVYRRHELLSLDRFRRDRRAPQSALVHAA